jgi:hypothetical protein
MSVQHWSRVCVPTDGAVIAQERESQPEGVRLDNDGPFSAALGERRHPFAHGPIASF